MASTSSSNVSESKSKKVPIKPSRGWIVRISNPVIPLDMYLQQWFADGNIVFGCGQTEVSPKGGHRHHQAYVVTKVNDKNSNGFGIKWMKDNIHSSAHFEPRRGTHEEARDYCTLEEYKGEIKGRVAGPWTVGAWSAEEAKQAGRKKGNVVYKKHVADLFEMSKQGASDRQLAEALPGVWAQHYKALDRYRIMCANDEPRPQPYIVVFWGPTGTGKSHDANIIMSNNGGGFTFRRGNGGNLWADGYDPVRHPVVIFDEMDGSFMTYRQLLRVTDKWQLVMDTKGGCVNFRPKIIIFTSSKHPKEWYSMESVPDTTELMRRLSGQYGAIIQKTIPWELERDAGPDLADVIDLLKTGDLVDQMRAATEQDDLEDIRLHEAASQAMPVGVDLTCQENIDDLDEDRDDGGVCDECGHDIRQCVCDDIDEAEALEAALQEDGYVAYSPRPMRTSLTAQAPPAPKPVRRTDSQFFLTRPPSAPASEFHKLGLVPGQARLDVKRKLDWQSQVVNDDDDDIDDKVPRSADYE